MYCAADLNGRFTVAVQRSLFLLRLIYLVCGATMYKATLLRINTYYRIQRPKQALMTDPLPRFTACSLSLKPPVSTAGQTELYGVLAYQSTVTVLLHLPSA
jgi:hypothetical protein